MRKPKQTLPIWAKVGTKVWVEIRDKLEQDVLEYLEGIITLCDHESKDIKIKYLNSEEEKEARVDRIHERIDSHGIVNDLANIPLLNDAEILKHLEIRYKQDLIHCYCGPTLIVINPYKRVDQENSEEKRELILQALKDGKLKDAEPHVWTISAISYDYLFHQGMNQAICISGESGAGKTECTKRCLEFITNLKTESKSLVKLPIEDKIMNCNPVLEAFGNAKTFRNDNSSRFGKYTILYVHKEKKSVKGASIENYLLEKSRITSLGKEERNYHIFYALCRFAPKDMLGRYKLLNDNGECDMKSFKYLNQSGVYDTPRVDDLEFYTEVNKAFYGLEFTEVQKDAIWRLLSTVLNLGNLELDESEYVEGSKPCKIKKNKSWRNVIELLEINENDFEMALTHKELKVANTTTTSPLSPAKSQNNIDSMAKEFYNRLFNWIVQKLNTVLKPDNPNDPSFATIGVLDIFGFEIFEKNSIEQFFINYANERLQGLYIEYIFKNECSIFEEEGLGEFTANIQYTDNKPILLSLDNTKLPPGVFDLVDQTCALNKTDENLHAEIVRAHKASEVISFPKFSKNLSFIVKHTARDVEYLTDNFVEKNKDELSLFLQNAVETSNKEIISIFKAGEFGGNGEKDKGVKNPKEKFLGYKFRKDMNDLVGQLSACFCHFIRCIKPNEFKRSNFWSAHLALMQIRYMGMLDSLKVRKMSYPFRFDYTRFFEIYQDLDLGDNGGKSFLQLKQKNADFKILSRSLSKNCGVDSTDKDVLYGATRIFLNERFKIDLDKMLLARQKLKRDALKTIQLLYASYLKRTNVKSYFVKESKSVMISRDLLKSWTAKIDGMKFRKFIDIVKKLQRKYRYMKIKRLKRFKGYNMKLISHYLGLYKFSKLNLYILHYKRKVLLMQALLDKKIKDAKNRFCKTVVNKAIDAAWSQITAAIVEKSSLEIQRIFRSHLHRGRKLKEYTILSKKMEDTKVFNSSSNIQRFLKGYLVRARLDRLNKAASKIQGYFRMLWMRRYFVNLTSAVIKIQKFLRKYNIRNAKIKEGMNEFLRVYSNYNQSVARLEYDILFADNDQYADLKNINDYTKLPFYLDKGELDFGKNNYKAFIPKMPNIELNPKPKFVSMLVDLDVHVDTTNVYYNTWANEFLSFMRRTNETGARLLHLEIGESFTLAFTDDKEVFSWGLNDYYQCARQGDGFSLDEGEVKNFSINNAKLLSAGKDHGMMVDDCNNIYIWGKNSEGQLGIDHSRQSSAIHVVNLSSDAVKAISAKEGVNYVLTNSSKIYSWPIFKQGENIFRPSELYIPETIKITSLDVGNDFAMFLSNTGLLYGRGNNDYGELGVGDNYPRTDLTLIRYLKDQGEKVVEMSCGYKHVICRTALNKIYTWGNNRSFQLGQGDASHRNLPTAVRVPDYKSFRFKARSVQAGLTSSFILMDDRQLYQVGTKGADHLNKSSFFERLSYEEKVY